MILTFEQTPLGIDIPGDLFRATFELDQTFNVSFQQVGTYGASFQLAGAPGTDGSGGNINGGYF